ncbi:mitochondrial carrier domain-containing protein [Podospora appendiculata]|uniref:Mitochondrial carrier domain-containing protein n=1 Tax=Podospora appendiculata TaxID=314037 RepID=A0AAE0XJE6_9PEZI|nr:mitochondrial carrier domain-containing protein [Podospora appendiculata]
MTRVPHDTENQTQANHRAVSPQVVHRDNEQAPLLANHDAADPHPDREHHDQANPATLPASWYIWRIFWLLLGTFLVAWFIKGWVDAGSDVDFDVGGALKKALGGGLTGAASMFLQVLLLMPLRTIMNYQYRFGSSFTVASWTLYHDGGFGRYYQGLGAALIQGPAARFVDAAANVGILALFKSNSYLTKMPTLLQSVFVSLCAASFRMTLTPIDTLKTTLQAQGARGTSLLRHRIKTNGIGSLWWGAFATAAATFVGNYPWWATNNFLERAIEAPSKEQHLVLWLLRLAFIGFAASVVSDTISNSLRVIKTYRQVNDTKVSYTEAAALVIRDDGISGLFGRGLKTRILCNGLQGLMFKILWKLFLDLWNEKTNAGA